MKPSIVLLFLILIPSAVALAQSPVNVDERQRLNGKWIFDEAKSGSSKRRYKEANLEISYTEPELRIVRTETHDNETKSATVTLFTDNRGEKNRPYPFNPDLEIASNTLWVKDTLVRTYAIKIYVSGKVAGSHAVRETYSLSKDGNSLTIIDESRAKISSETPWGDKLNTDHKGKLKRVYNRVK